MNLIPNIIRNYVLIKLSPESRVVQVEIIKGSAETGDEGKTYVATNIQADVSIDKWDAITVIAQDRDTEIGVADRIVLAYEYYRGQQRE